MIKNYLLVALRSLRRQKGYAAINILGLAVGMACCLLILLFVRDELAYDRFHEQADRIVRLTTKVGVSDATHFAGAAAPMAAVMQETFPEVAHATRILPSDAVVRVGNNVFWEERFYFADSTVFDVFSFPLLEGDSQTALAAPFSVVLTQEMTRKYFGEADPVGQKLQVDGDTYTVTGVVENVPRLSHFRFDFLASMTTLRRSQSSGPDAWVSDIGYYTYLLMRPGASAAALEQKLPALVEQNVGDLLRRFGATFSLHLQPLTDIHLHSHLDYEIEPNGNIAYVYIFSSVALFILLIACINFMNLATARSVDRAKEVGVRKVLGAYRLQLVRQFLSESVLLAALALLLSLVLAKAVLPFFNELTGRTLSLSFFDNGLMLVGFAGVALLVGVLAGSYPALFLSRFRPAQVLKGRFTTDASGVLLRKGLVVTQFAISTILIIGTSVVTRQLDYAQSQRLGFDKEQVVVLPVHQDPLLRERLPALKQEILNYPGVVHTAAADHFPGGPINDHVLIPEGASDDEGIHFWRFNADFDFVETLAMEVIAGRDFSEALSTDSAAFLINETAAQMLGWPSPVGRSLIEMEGPGPGGRTRKEVIGVVKDFHFESFRHTIRPLIIAIDPEPAYLLARLRPNQISNTLAFLRQLWEEHGAGTPFSYTFLDERFDSLYRAEEQLSQVFRAFTMLAILIACLGLFGLAAYTAEQRTKEIGVRKVLGASVASIVALLSKDFLKLVLVAAVIAAPVAYLAMDRWLEGFAYHVELSLWIFLGSGAAAALIALLTVSYQAIRAALQDPVQSLRYE